LKLKINKEALAKIETSRADQESTRQGNVIILDDEASNLYALEKILAPNFTVFPFLDPNQALEKLQNDTIDVIISDQRMPQMLGTEFFTESMKINPDNVRIILTGYTDVNDLIRCINNGLIYRYLVKPWDRDELLQIVKQAIEKVTQDRTLKQVIPHKVIERLYPNGLQTAKPGQGRSIFCACMFVDIVAFTEMAEKMSPDETFEFLTTFMGALGPVIQNRHGFIDKYLGDGIMAVFDRPGHFPEDAVACAVDIIAAIETYNQETETETGTQSPPRAPVRVGIGIHLGKVFLGTIGFPGRIDFTILGDVVNTTARIQSLTKTFGADVIVHADIAARLPKEHFVRRYLGTTSVRGKKEMVPLWEIYEIDTDAVKQHKSNSIDSFFEAIVAWESHDFEKAEKLLKIIVNNCPTDAPANYYLDKIGNQTSHPLKRQEDD